MTFNIIDGIRNFIRLVNDNWTIIVIALGLLCTFANRVHSYMQLSKQERIEAIKISIKAIMLEKVTDAEVEYEDWISAGAIKRSQVINKIYEMYPELYNVVDQEGLIKWMDEAIDEALKVMRQIFEENQEFDENEE